MNRRAYLRRLQDRVGDRLLTRVRVIGDSAELIVGPGEFFSLQAMGHLVPRPPGGGHDGHHGPAATP
jgi:hypothetical protein